MPGLALLMDDDQPGHLQDNIVLAIDDDNHDNNDNDDEYLLCNRVQYGLYSLGMEYWHCGSCLNLLSDNFHKGLS